MGNNHHGCNGGNGALILPYVEDQRLAAFTRSFEQLMSACPPELSVRQRILSERRGDFLFIEIRTSFKIAVTSSEV